MANDIGWELYRSFLGVLQEGSLSGAARALGITQPTVGRHISALEKSLGLALFTRSQTGLLPTEAALSLRSYAEAMNSTAAAFKRAADSHGEGVKGTVRIAASEVIGVEVLPPIMAGLQQKHPQLKVELVACNSQFSSALRAGAADCFVTRLANMRRLFDAARFAHSARAGAPFTPESTVTGH